MPRLDLIPHLFSSALLLAFVIYVSTYSLEKMFANKHGYKIHANQELIALGTANMVSSFFMCYPCSGSLSRSAVQDKVGGKTQLASLISSVLVILFILFLSTYLETLPKVSFRISIDHRFSSALLLYSAFYQASSWLPSIRPWPNLPSCSITGSFRSWTAFCGCATLHLLFFLALTAAFFTALLCPLSFS